MSNVRKGPSSKGVPKILEAEGMLPPRCPPETIESQLNMAKGKAGMNWTHPQLAPEQHYVDSEEGGDQRDPDIKPSMESEGRRDGNKDGGRGGGKKNPRHRSTTGAPGHGLVGN